jgi:hypothetical protein
MKFVKNVVPLEATPITLPLPIFSNSDMTEMYICDVGIIYLYFSIYTVAV